MKTVCTHTLLPENVYAVKLPAALYAEFLSSCIIHGFADCQKSLHSYIKHILRASKNLIYMVTQHLL